LQRVVEAPHFNPFALLHFNGRQSQTENRYTVHHHLFHFSANNRSTGAHRPLELIKTIWEGHEWLSVVLSGLQAV
jgi:hypothetical protein